jgi:hypothetical protein
VDDVPSQGDHIGVGVDGVHPQGTQCR